MPTLPQRPGPGRRSAQGVTTARLSVEQDRAKRMWEYLLAMGFRILAFPASVWLLMNDQVVVGLVLAVAAMVIPSIAVALANNVDHRSTSSAPVSPARPQRHLEKGSEGSGEAPPHGVGSIPGTVVSSHDTPYRPGGGPHGQDREAS